MLPWALAHRRSSRDSEIHTHMSTDRAGDRERQSSRRQAEVRKKHPSHARRKKRKGKVGETAAELSLSLWLVLSLSQKLPRTMTSASGTQLDHFQVLSTLTVARVREKIEGIVVLPPQQFVYIPRPDQAAVCTWAPSSSPIW